MRKIWPRILLGLLGIGSAFFIAPGPQAAEKAKPKATVIQLKLEQGKPTILEGTLTKNDPLDQGKYFKTYAFQGEAGKVYRFEARGDYNPMLRLKNADGKVIGEESDGGPKFSRLAFQPTKSDTYHLIVTSESQGSVGAFTLNAVIAEQRTAVIKALSIKDMSAREEDKLTDKDGTDLQGKYLKIYTFEGKKGQLYRFEAKGNCEPLLRLEDQAGRAIKSEDYGDGLISRLAYQPLKDDAFRLVVTTDRPSKTGNFTLTLAVAEAKAAVVIPAAFQSMKLAKHSGSLSQEDGINAQGQYYKLYTLTAKPGKLYRFELSTVAPTAEMPKPAFEDKLIPPRLAADAPAIFVQIEVDGKSVKKSSNIAAGATTAVYQAEKTEELRVLVVAERLEGPFLFNLSIAESDPIKERPPQSLPVEFKDAKIVNVEGRLTDDDAIDFLGRPHKIYTFKSEAGKLYRIEASSHQFSLVLELQDARGKLFRVGSYTPRGQQMTFRSKSAEDFRLLVTAERFGKPGGFTLSINESTPAPVKIEPLSVVADKPAIVDGSLNADDPIEDLGKYHKVYSFQGKAGTAYRIDLHSKAFDAYLFLKDDSDTTLKENDDNGESLDSRIIYKMVKTGTYRIVATSLSSGRTGPYTLTVAEAGPIDLIQLRVDNLYLASKAERKALIEDLAKEMQANKDKLGRREANLAMRVANSLTDAADLQLMQQAYSELGKALFGSSDFETARAGRKMQGAGKRMGLVGQAMELKGRTVTGEDYDIAAAKDKVVLVHFFASWDSRSRQEVAAIQAAYKTYHGKGFDVIGVSLDDIKDEWTDFMKKEKLPWPVIYDRDQAKDKQLADLYGVFNFPQAILVGADGRVLSVNARPPELERLLKEQFDKK